MTTRQVQCLLQYLGYYESEVDGIWGPLTEDALRRFQSDYGVITADGALRAETEKALKDAVCIGMPKYDKPDTGTFWDHIRYWTRDEFRCQCGGKYCNGFPAEPDQTLVELVDDLRHRAGAPGYRSSGLRCKIWNGIQGGVANSRHLSGKALDFRIQGMTGEQLLALAQSDKRTRYSYIIDNGPYVHVDVE